ncbi:MULTISPECIES: YycH family regulatory protein [Pontibacillus]|uniref:Two-component system activity regulator YycH n=1 Tax=Pontibacillus chungwhensis TaxID=265426 RepID=A0ABY8UY30_9BACI|nr:MULTISPECIES: two-component system activity regulator YycH [Pontibacillus]MCD5325640.1 two-component system activity regulator YycH [Pontibacillus sp. HN14]WIF98113.1 two-component system activity regulator YycH [Pontibacillus chungwhensis]
MWEYLKSIILGLLVTISLLVTFALWTYQPEYDDINNGSPILEAETKLNNGVQQSVSDIIKPELLLFHQDERHFSLKSWNETKNLYEKIVKWPLTDINLVSKDVIETESSIEIVYPAGIPLSTLASTFTIGGEAEKDVKEMNMNIDQIFISFTQNQSKYYDVYFVSRQSGTAYSAVIRNFDVSNAVEKYLTGSNSEMEYFSVDNYFGNPVYLPESQVTLPVLPFQAQKLNVETMKNVLFNNPKLVKRNSTYGETFYNIDNRLMKVSENERHMRFEQFQTDETNELSRQQLIKQSLNDINDHNGWTANSSYHLFDIRDNVIDYRIFQDGYPVLDGGKELSLKITQTWRNQDLVEYERPLIQLRYPILNPNQHDDILSGREILPYIEDQSFEDIKIGYRVEIKGQQELVILLEPAWFIKYVGQDDWEELVDEGSTE